MRDHTDQSGASVRAGLFTAAVQVDALKHDGTLDVDLHRRLSGDYTVPAGSPELPTYDADGNMLSYDGWTYAWTAQDRLVSATRGTTRLEFNYDYLGRRFEKKVYESNVLVKHQKFVYDGFKQIAEYDALDSNSLSNTYLWQPVGLDVPLLRNGEEFFVSDANKNIVALLDTTGSVTDTYLYDPFGNCTHTGSSTNPFRFSSEYYDGETGLVYYNYRYYSVKLGRWLSRDPIGEYGGINMYIIANNSSINFFDRKGEISLATKIMTTLGGRIAKIGALGIIGIIHNWYSFSNPIALYDDEKEVALFSHTYAMKEIREDVRFQTLFQANYIELSIGQFNAAKKYGEQGVFTLSGDSKFSTDWWLKNTSVYLMAIDYKAKCQGNIIFYKDVQIKYEWHDIIDGNSFVESYKAGNLFDSIGGFISNTIEGMWDIVMEKIAGTDFKIVIKGDTSIPDAQFPFRQQ